SGGIAQRDQDTAETKAAQRLTRHDATDALDNDIDALTGRYPPNAVGETFRGKVNHVFEAELACLGGLRGAAGRRYHLAGALCPRELISCVADRPAYSRRQYRLARLESRQRQRGLRCEIGHWKAGRDDVADRVGHKRQMFGPRQQPFLPPAILTNTVGPGEHHAASDRET